MLPTIPRKTIARCARSAISAHCEAHCVPALTQARSFPYTTSSHHVQFWESYGTNTRRSIKFLRSEVNEASCMRKFVYTRIVSCV